MLGFLPTRAYRPGTPGATTFLSPLSGTFNYGWDSFLPTWRVMQPTINEALEREENEAEPTEPSVTSNCSPFNSFGLPAASIPCGFSADGLPIGLMIAGPRFSEGRVLALANAYEKATEWHTRRPALSLDMPVPPIDRKDRR